MKDIPGIVPSCLVPELYSPWLDQPGFVARQVETVAAAGLYRAVELAPVRSAEDRAAIRRACDESGLDVAVWLTSALERDGLDICAPDENRRREAVAGASALLAGAAECGATAVAVVGGADPGPELRKRGYDSCRDSLLELCENAARLGMSVMMEPLDRFAHKKRLVGPTAEAVDLFARVRSEFPDFGFAFDTAHAALNEEDWLASLDQAAEQIVNLHLSNAVLDPRDPLYGDHHMMPGRPGFLTAETAAQIVARTSRIAQAEGRTIRLAVEARAPAESGEQETAETARHFLEEVTRIADTLLAGESAPHSA